MAADYAGAIAAIKSRFEANWLTDGARKTPFCYLNEAPCETVDESGTPISWCLVEIVHSGSYLLASGTPGNRPTAWDMLIKVHVMSPTGTGSGEGGGGLMLALSAGEIFRNALFYNTVTSGCYVRSGYEMQGQPRIDEGDVNSNDGSWFATTATIPAEYVGLS
jgi:hypothetical protein